MKKNKKVKEQFEEDYEEEETEIGDEDREKRE